MQNKLKVIYETILKEPNQFDYNGNPICKVMIGDVLNFVKSKGWNMVVSCGGRIMFNKSGTPHANGSYKECVWGNLTQPIDNEPEVISFIYDIIMEGKNTK